MRRSSLEILPKVEFANNQEPSLLGGLGINELNKSSPLLVLDLLRLILLCFQSMLVCGLLQGLDVARVLVGKTLDFRHFNPPLPAVSDTSMQ
jgi:hypothetical protein